MSTSQLFPTVSNPGSDRDEEDEVYQSTLPPPRKGKERARDHLGRYTKSTVQDALTKLEKASTSAEEKQKLRDLIQDQLEAAETISGLVDQEYQDKKHEREREVTFSTFYRRKLEADLERASKERDALKKELKEEKQVKEADLYETLTTELDIKVAKPPTFSGKPEDVNSFLASCELVFRGQKRKYATTRSRILYILSYCTEGTPLTWRERILDEFEKFMDEIAEIVTSGEAYTNWEAFRHLFKRTWRSITSKAEAQVKLQKLKQGDRPIEEYITQFMLLAQVVEFNDEALMLAFKRGMKEAIKAKIYATGIIPKNIKDWIERARIMDQAYREFELEKGSTPFQRTYSGKARVAKWEPSQKNDTKFQRPRLPDDVYKKRKDEKLCFKCGNKGHFAKECYAKARVNQAEPAKEDTSREKEEQQDFI